MGDLLKSILNCRGLESYGHQKNSDSRRPGTRIDRIGGGMASHRPSGREGLGVSWKIVLVHTPPFAVSISSVVERFYCFCNFLPGVALSLVEQHRIGVHTGPMYEDVLLVFTPRNVCIVPNENCGKLQQTMMELIVIVIKYLMWESKRRKNDLRHTRLRAAPG